MTHGLDQLRQRRPDRIPEIDPITGVLVPKEALPPYCVITQEWVNGHLIDPLWMRTRLHCAFKKRSTRFCPVRVDTFGDFTVR